MGELERGPMVIAYRHDGRDYMSGGWTEADTAMLTPHLEADGCTGIRVYDGIAEAREKFAPGSG